MGYWIGVVLLVLGLPMVFGTLAHNVWRNLISREHGAQAAPSRMPPELLFVGAVLTGIGAWLVWR